MTTRRRSFSRRYLLLAHELGLAVVAEGIQSQEHVDRLGALDCDMGQGNFIGEPMTAKQVVDALSGLPYAAAATRASSRRCGNGSAVAPETTAPPPPVWQTQGYERMPPAPYPEVPAPYPEAPAATSEAPPERPAKEHIVTPPKSYIAQT